MVNSSNKKASFRKLLLWFSTTNTVLLVVVSMLVILNIYASWKNNYIFDKVVIYEGGEIKAKVKLLNHNVRTLSITQEELENIRKERYYNTLAGSIIEHYFTQGEPYSFKNIKTLLQAIEEVVPKYFSEGPFTEDDFLALAAIESSFNMNQKGKHGETGAFQIKSSRELLVKLNDPLANPFDCKTNTRLACHVLKEKYKKYGTYRDTIIAYNGYVVKKGKVEDKYWKNFQEAKQLIKKLKKMAKRI
jgi:hypothetical protein